MDLILSGFINVLNPVTLLYITLGVAGGIIIGSLPGLTATMGVTLLLPLTFGMEASNGILLLLGIYIGAIYGGSISAILLRTPGTPAAAATALDGYALTKNGESGKALAISTIASAIGGVVSCILLILISPQLASIALKFSSPEYFALALFGLSIITSISGKSLVKGLIAGFLGILIAMIGVDAITGYTRFTFGSVNLLTGMSFIPILIGLFALSQAFIAAENKNNKSEKSSKVKSSFPSKKDFKAFTPRAIVSGIMGTFIGIIPGAGADIAAFICYNEAKRFSKHPEKFGTGLPEAIAAPEAGNNGVTGGAMIPLLTLGIPGDAVAAVMLGALTMQGLQPGPLLFKEQASTVYMIFAGLLVANIIMLILGLLGSRVFPKITNIPQEILTPAIIVLCVVGSFAINNSFFDVGVMFVSGVIGYFMHKFEIPSSPVILALILGPMAESHLRRALVMSNGSFSVLVSTPISVIFIVLAIITLMMPIIKKLKTNKEESNGDNNQELTI